AVIKKMVTGQDPLVSLRASLYEASSGDDAVTRLDRADVALRAMGVNDQDVYHLPWKHWLGEEPAIRAFARRLAGRSIDEWDELEWDAVAAAHRAGEAVAAAAIKKILIARNRNEFTSFREHVAAAHANENPALAATKFLYPPAGLGGSDVYSLDWLALLASQKAVTQALVSRWIEPRHIKHWTEKDWGTVAEASRSGEAFAAAVIKRIVADHDLIAGLDVFADYREALNLAWFNKSFGGKNAEAPFRFMQAADRLRHGGIDILSLEWAILSVREQAQIKTLVRDSLGSLRSTVVDWTAREWGAVAVGHEHAGQAAALATAKRQARSPQPGQKRPGGGLHVWTMQADSNTANLNMTILDRALADPAAGPGTEVHRQRLRKALDSHRPASAAVGRAAGGGQNDRPDTTGAESATDAVNPEALSLVSGGVPRHAVGRVTGTPGGDASVAGAGAVAGDSDDGLAVVGDDETMVAGGGADDATVGGEDLAAGEAGAEQGKSGPPGSGHAHDRVRAWLAGQSPDAGLQQKAFLLDPDSRFPAEDADDDATLVDGGDAGESTRVDSSSDGGTALIDDAESDEKKLGHGKNDRTNDGILAWRNIIGHDPQKEALFDPHSRFPAVITVNPARQASGGALEGRSASFSSGSSGSRAIVPGAPGLVGAWTESGAQSPHHSNASLSLTNPARRALSLVGNLQWSGGSRVDEEGRLETQTGWGKRNDFAMWLRDEKFKITQESVMSCWDAILFSAYQAGSVTPSQIRDIYARAAREYLHPPYGDPDVNERRQAWLGSIKNSLKSGVVQEYRINRVTKVGSANIPEGYLIFFGGMEHVAISTGVRDRHNHQQVVSLWVYPSHSPAGQMTKQSYGRMQLTSVEQLAGAPGVQGQKIEYSAPFWGNMTTEVVGVVSSE
ncbi:hypothetical protein PV350_43350, partial [Streptomyces sp. PA03-6a]|nr:hypothetical protein [Streptomyces sp. PA03-6a]